MYTNVINNANVLTPDLSTSVSTESAQVEKPPALGSQSQSSSSGSGSLNPGSSTASTVPVSPVLQSPAPPLLQDPILLRQLLPALQTALQLNNTSVDMAKINEGEFTSVRVQRAPVSVTKRNSKSKAFIGSLMMVPLCSSASLSSSHRCCHTSVITVDAPQDPHRRTVGLQHHYYPVSSCSTLQPR